MHGARLLGAQVCLCTEEATGGAVCVNEKWTVEMLLVLRWAKGCGCDGCRARGLIGVVGVYGNGVINVHAVHYSCPSLASPPSYCMPGRSLHRTLRCLHVCSDRAHKALV